ncbi:MAG: hypothetical protein JSS82_10710 [Bacteroidetes bacterium]|nr:hypothetical protein [Bacteroidota bacterium]
MNSSVRFLRILLAAFFMLATFQMSAQQFEFPDRRFSNKKSIGAIVAHGFPDTIKVETDMWTFMNTNPSWWSSYKIKSLHDFAKFYVDNDTVISASIYNYQVCLKVYYYTNPASPNTAAGSFLDTLSITYRPDSLSPYQDKHYHKFSNYHKIMLVITDIIDRSETIAPYPVHLSSMPVGYSIPGYNSDVEAEIWQQRYDKSPYGGTYPPSNITSAYNSNKSTLKVAFWDTVAVPKPTPGMYELEWTYVDDYDYTFGTGPGTLSTTQLQYDFKNNATRIITSNKSYEIPVVYERGYLVFRARIIRPDSVTYNAPVYTDWSVTNNSGLISSLTSGTNYYHISQSHAQDSLNWQYTVSFAEGGKYKQVMNYFDGSLKNRETITKFNSLPDYTLATENIYDFKGRPSIGILPTPVPDSNFRYIYGLDINSATGKPYKAADFDTLPPIGLCPGEFSVSPLDSTAWAYIYYSKKNADKSGFQKFIPDAEGYPLIHTILSPENDKRIFKQGGAGPKLQMADSNTTNYDYVMPEQSELNRLFGTEVGWSEYYKKIVVRDPNRQRSYSITDNEGRTVASGMIGEGPDSSTHPIDPYSIPNASSIKEDLLDGNIQVPIDHIWSLDKSFFVEAEGNHTLQYTINVPPFPVCGGDEYLTIGASYDYKVFDNCGNVLMSQADTLGVTGEWHTPVVNNLNAAANTAYLGAGAYYLSKNMTYNMDSVGVAVDKFLDDTATCLHNEDWFIRNVVQSKNFPCPLDTNSCEARKRRMMAELWPGAKYGHYNPGFGDTVEANLNAITPPLPQNGFSIFDFFCLSYPPPYMSPGPPGDYCAFRYQWCSNIIFPDTVWKNGQPYTNIGNLPVDTFIYIFNDDIAEALLPLHPEYCKKCDSAIDNDNYEALLKSIPDYNTASQLGYLKLTDIITHDPMYTALQAYMTPTQAFDSLAFPRFSDRRMDSICIAMAFCGGVDTTQSRICYDQIFNNEVTNGNYNIGTAPPAIQNLYFQRLIPLYIGNRSIRKKIIGDMDTAVHCAPCDSFRMVLQPPGVDGPTVYSPTTTDSAMLAQLFSGLDNGVTMPFWAFAVLAGDTDSTSIDSVTQLYNGYHLSFCDTQVAQIARKLINCSTDTNVINHIHDSLYNYYCVGAGVNSSFTPDIIRNVIVHYAGSVNDLCNPYLVNMNPLPNPQTAGATFVCKSSGYYLDAYSFLSRSGIAAAINGGSMQRISLSPGNTFENQLISTLGLSSPYTVNVNYSHEGSNLYRLMLADSSNVNDSISFWFKKSDPVGMCAPALEDLNYWSPRNVVCMRSAVGTMLPSMINGYSFATDVFCVNGTDSGLCRLLIWNDRMALMDTSVESGGPDCIACSEIKTVYDAFNDTLNAYGMCCADHPYYGTMLWNYINYTMNRQYVGSDIQDFIASCALADSTAFRNLYGLFKLSGISSSSIQTIISHLNTTYNTSLDFFKYKKNAASTYDLVLSFGNIPTESLLKAKNYIADDSAGLSYTYRYGKSLGNDTLAVVFVPSDINSSTWLPPLITDMGGDFQSKDSADVTVVFSIDPAATTMAYKEYFIKNQSGLPFYKLVQYTDTLNKILYTNTYGVQTFSQYNPFINQDYNRQEKKDFLTYNYGFNDSVHYMILKKLGADSLKANIANYASKNVTYQNPYVINDDGDLFISTNQFADPGFAIADSVIAAVTRVHAALDAFHQPVANRLFFYNVNQRISPPSPGPTSGDSLNVYRCGDDKTYWYRYFKHDKLYNMYIQIPDFVQNSPDWLYYPGSFKVGQGDGTIYRFNVSVTNPSYPGLKVALYGYTDFSMGTVLDMRKSLLCLGQFDGVDVPDTTTCERYTLTDAIQEGKHDYLIYRDSVKQKTVSDYVAFLDTSITEEMYLTSRDQKYHFTIYYYDRAGNLIRTVPPAGVRRMDTTMTLNDSINDDRDGSIIEAATMPVHYKSSFYTYNSINNVVKQITPDGGTTDYYYDAVGRVVYSQNDHQRPYGTVAYTLYDAQGRIIETGELYDACPPTCVSCIPGLLSNITNSANYTWQETYNFIIGRKRSQVVATRYDDESMNLDTVAGMTRQQNLRKRVSAVKFFPTLLANQLGNNTNTSYTHATYYSYDIAGNVKTLTHDYPDMPLPIHRYKRIDYDYDMLSGKVNMLSYNRGIGDQFYQRYSYDADNRLTKVETSNDGIYWDDDADYKYYKHGPMARMELGDRRVQALDYAYTIQGWIKSLNSDITDTAYDMGGDGKKNSIFPPDAFSYGLDYFPNDYKPIGDSAVMHIAAIGKGLYNGNIARQNTSLMPLPSLNKEYRYDPLNRITNGQYYNINRNSNNALTATNAYKNHYTYDEDGNFQTLKRYGGVIATGQYSGVIMDSLTYWTQPHKNQLFDVLDSADNSYGSLDIQKHTHPDVPLFYYDEIGRLIHERRTLTNQDSIHWSLYNKVNQLSTLDGPRMGFSYDGAGNRLTKTNYSYGDSSSGINTDYYVRDASGNILAILNYDEQHKMKSVPIVLVWTDILHLANNNPHVISPYVFNGDFAHDVVRQASLNATLTNNILSPLNASLLIFNDPSVLLNPCIQPPILIHDVAVYGPTPLVHGLEADMPRDLAEHVFRPYDIDTVITIDTTGGDTTYVLHADTIGRVRTAMDYWIAKWPSAYDSLCHVVGLGLGDTLINDSIRHYHEDSLLVYKPYFIDYAGMLLGGSYDSANFASRDSLVFAWLRDSVVYMADTFTSGGSSGTMGGVTGVYPLPTWTDVQWQGLLRHLYDTTALADSDRLAFGNSAVAAGIDISYLESIAGTEHMLDLAYRMNPDSFLSKWLAVASDTDVAYALSAMPNMTAAKAANDMAAIGLHVGMATTLENVLVSQRFGLSEHHLYGTGRLGIRDYAVQFGSSWSWNDTTGYVSPDSAYVNTRVPWRSLAMGDFMLNDVTEPVWSHLDLGKWYTTRILGLKRYELNSHLGDVQATVLDKTTRKWNPTFTQLLYTHADISTMTDYYPYGMPMPARTIITDSIIIEQAPPVDQFMMYNPDSSLLPDNYPAQQAFALGNWSQWPQDTVQVGHLNWLGTGSGLQVVCDTFLGSAPSPYGTKLYMHTDSGKHYTLRLLMDVNNAGVLGAVVYVNHPSGGSSTTTLATQSIPASGGYTINFTAVDDTTWLAVGSPAMGKTKSFRIAAARMNNVIQTIIANGFLIPGYYGKRNYRFAYNNKEKVSEISGEGNHYVYGFREYDPRIAFFWSVDPLTAKYPWYSPYQFAGNTPIQAIDVEGAEELKVTQPATAFYGRIFLVVQKSEELKRLTMSISRPDRAEKQLVYLTVNRYPNSVGEHGFTTSQNIKPLAQSMVAFDQAVSSGAWKNVENKEELIERYNSNKAYFENLNIDYNEVANAKQAEVFAVSVYSDEAEHAFRGSAKTLGHEVAQHLIDKLNHLQKTAVQQHMENYDIKEGSAEYTKYNIEGGSSPNDEDVKPNSPAGKLNQAIDKAVDKTFPNEK